MLAPAALRRCCLMPTKGESNTSADERGYKMVRLKCNAEDTIFDKPYTGGSSVRGGRTETRAKDHIHIAWVDAPRTGGVYSTFSWANWEEEAIRV